MSFILQNAGPVFWILVIEAVAACFIFLERLAGMRRAQIDYQDFLKGVMNVLDAGNVDEAIAICEDSATPVGNITAIAIRRRGNDEASLHENVESQARAEMRRLERRLGTLSIMGDIAPLIGLFGTLAGFISTLLKIDSQTVVSRVDLLSGAMGALVCAATGLLVTIIISVMHGSLRLRLERISVELEAAVNRITGYMLSGKGTDGRR